jgi:hypothetical protein
MRVMPAHEVPKHELTELLDAAFAALVELGDVDVVTDAAPAEFEVQADEWTLHLEGWPLTAGFLALDDEPTTENERRNALDAAIDGQYLAALRRLDRDLGGALSVVLAESGDALSLLLVPLLRVPDGDDLLDTLEEAPPLL